MTRANPLLWPEGWPRAKSRKQATFGKSETKRSAHSNSTYQLKRSLSIEEGVKRVRAELAKFGVDTANDMVVSTNLRLNLAGYPRGDETPADPGVAVYWEKKGAPPRVMAIDAYTRVADNLAAIAATLDAMRAIERHGGAQILDRAFTGFTALPPPVRWHQVLGVPATASPDEVNAAHRRLALEHHPDRENGSAVRMSEINAARDAALREIGL
jgi:hypothetical protein